MTFEMLYSKIHRATVSDANLNYVGSITIDEDLMKAANLRVGQKVDIVNINNGERFQTYIIKGKAGSKDMCLNGAAARKVEIGDKIIVIAYATFSEAELENYKPTVVLVDDKNNIELITHELEGGKYV
ncbi:MULTISPECIES: aspartate 1-decarboxylase [Arcobacteraceae]|jgi:aspartate 1-decarboxylase|uniref:Aspartate 1-decarboxylase n=6 Tax=root TaxID=1 RepID=PAND_ALIB4|nr:MULTISPECIES: aspartate 1-decarboxylase [Arcobacteraceae]A8ERX9.1 RecName: Full=Aspartate 1-decarboxylase; AltName: Full=Aspartate alpha-decarboxylase; Contains: RecName: Full=Aspartate 1-decarboxylase beta chain; Contains: RecName: Full=Aspartate 1-decarboxylase alpha chain; Flags: Precursor [Aliarcobacter butzleri RM4018]MCP3648615.1 aspartate 1-decarboxylase [Arcobacter sp. DNRA7]ABV66703.1 aspartate 1-decarboxylase [Aliarcobacter butzleri RM4018]AGR76755.1 aspartate 1-decarboxylase precu